jgi:hypothetical protein
MFLYLVLAVFILVFGLVLGLIRYKKLMSPVREKEKLKATGRKIQVDLSKCEIKSSSFTEESINTSFSTASALSGLLKPKSLSQSPITDLSVIVYYHEGYDSRKYRSDVINLPEQTLQFYMMQAKHTYIYVDPKHPESYYFDVSFISE